MDIEELAFKDRKNLAQLNELDLLDIIEFLQKDRKQWVEQFTKTYNKSVEIQARNRKLKDNWNKLKEFIVESNKTLCWTNNYDSILGKMEELQGSDSNVKY